MRIGEADRCPVCAMRPKQHAKFASAIELKDGTTYYFCGTGCMLRTWLHPDAFVGAAREQLKRAVVREYFSGDHVDAAGVVWVTGSDVVGPMGPAIVPLADEQAAETFKKRHGGKATFKLAELDDAKWEQLTGKKAGR
jgi:nitrous oxide reductase accessory protein NosL